MPSRASALGPSIGSAAQAGAGIGARRRIVGGSGSVDAKRVVTPRRAATTTRAARPRGTPPRRPRGRAPRRRRDRAARCSPAMQVSSSAPSAICASVARERLCGVAPGHELAAGVADGVAGREAALRVVARGRGHAAHAQRLGGLAHGRLVGVRSMRWGRRRAARRGPPAGRWSAPRARASPTAPPRARRRGSRWGCWAAPAPRRRAPRGCPRAARRSRGSSSRRRPPPALQAPRRGASRPRPLATATTAQVVRSTSAPSPPSRALRSATCSCMSATSKRETSPAPRTAPRRGRARRCGRARAACGRRPPPGPSRRSSSSSAVKRPASRSSPVTAKFVQ